LNSYTNDIYLWMQIFSGIYINKYLHILIYITLIQVYIIQHDPPLYIGTFTRHFTGLQGIFHRYHIITLLIFRSWIDRCESILLITTQFKSSWIHFFPRLFEEKRWYRIRLRPSISPSVWPSVTLLCPVHNFVIYQK
jgi:hypothetical protein